MRALVIHAAKDLRIEDRPESLPGDDEVEVQVEVGGICGSDLHYYNHGGFGAVRLREPMVLGHEVAGRIVSRGARVSAFAPGQRVAISPSRPCGQCQYCAAGLPNHCMNMRFYGSAMPYPHIQGAFQQRLVALQSQCHPIADDVSMSEAAAAEPFAVALHAVSRAGSLLGKRVLVTGCGPIGALVVMAARLHGAREIVVTDVVDHVLEIARTIGADQTINVASAPHLLEAQNVGKGTFDVHFEASGNAQAIRQGLDVLKPRGILVQLALGGDISVPQNVVVAKEIEIRGTFRFHEEFALAVDLMNRRRADLRPLLTGAYPFDNAQSAFEVAGDRMRAMKVQITF